MKKDIEEILIGNADDYDQLSDNQAPSYKFYYGTLDGCIEEINDLFKSKIEEVVEDVKQEIKVSERSLMFDSGIHQYDKGYKKATNEGIEQLQTILIILKKIIGQYI